MTKKIYTITFAILVIFTLSMILIDGYYHKYSYMDEDGTIVVLDYDDLIGCTNDIYFDEETQSWQLNKYCHFYILCNRIEWSRVEF